MPNMPNSAVSNSFATLSQEQPSSFVSSSYTPIPAQSAVCQETLTDEDAEKEVEDNLRAISAFATKKSVKPLSQVAISNLIYFANFPAEMKKLDRIKEKSRSKIGSSKRVKHESKA
jgi:hypothetical protein